MQSIWEGEVFGMAVRVVVSSTEPLVMCPERRDMYGTWHSCDNEEWISIVIYKTALEAFFLEKNKH